MEYSKEDLMEAKKQILGVGENMGTEESKKIWEKNAQFWDNAMGDKSNEFHREVVRPKVFGYITYAPGTLIIKSAMAFVAWLIYKLLSKATGKEMLGEIVGGIVGVLVMTTGYFFYEIMFFTTAGVAIVNAPWNLLQGGAGVTLSVILMRVLTVTKALEKLNLYK